MMNLFTRTAVRRVLTCALMVSPLAAGAQEFRGVWCSRFQWASTTPSTAQNNITGVLNNMVTGRFNTMFFQVRGQCDVMYPSPDEPWSLLVSNNGSSPGWDPLQYAVDAAHSRGIQLHCYFNTHTVWGGATNAPPQSTMPNHVYYQHANPNDPARRDWLLYNASGSPTTYSSGSDEYLWLNPGIPAADAFVRKQAAFLVTNYAIDGLHFDRVRMPAAGYGKNPIAVARWDNPNTSTANDGPGNPQRLAWDAYMRDCITRQVMNICGQCWGHNRLVPMSSSPLGLWEYSTYYQNLSGYSSGFQWAYRLGQDAKAWMQMGAQDFIVPQIYWANGGTKPDFNEVYTDWLNAANTYGRYVVGGANNSVGQTEVESNCNYIRSRGGNGKGLNLWHSTNTNFSTWSAAGHPYAGSTPATPSFPWRSSEGVITGKIYTNASLGTPVTDAWITRSGSTWTALSSGDGFFCFLRVPPGTYTLNYTHPTHGSGSVGSVTVTAGQATHVNLRFSSSPGAGEIVIDNPAATVAGTWTTAATAPDKFGSDYRYKGAGTGSSYLQFTPSIPAAGNYDVYEWHSQGGNRAAAVPHVIAHASGSTTVNVNQKANGGGWNKLGTFNFAAGTAGNVRVTDNFSGSSIVGIADAIRFVPVSGATTVIVDNSNSGFSSSANWSTGTSAADKYGTDYRFHNTATGTVDHARWTYSVPQTRSYQISAWWSQGTNRSSAAPYLVTHSGGTSTVNRNQQANGGSWQLIGTYNLNSGTNRVELSASAPSGFVVIADAIRAVAQ